MLDLGDNQIGDQGAQHLGNALQQNKVTFSCSSYITHLLLHIGTYRPEYCEKSYWWPRSTTSC